MKDGHKLALTAASPGGSARGVARGESRAARRGPARVIVGTPSLVAETAGGVTPQRALERRRHGERYDSEFLKFSQ